MSRLMERIRSLARSLRFSLEGVSLFRGRQNIILSLRFEVSIVDVIVIDLIEFQGITVQATLKLTLADSYVYEYMILSYENP